MQQPQLTTSADIDEVKRVTGAATCSQLLTDGWVLLGVLPLTNDEWLLGRPRKPRRDRFGFRGKKFWDWMSLLVVPLFITVATGALGFLQFWIETQRADAQQQIEDDRVREAVLQSYIQDMTELLLVRHLATSAPEQPVRHIARSSTLTALRQLDADRKAILLQFLYESNLIGTATVDESVRQIEHIEPVINLRGADLSGANLSSADLRGADLSRAFLIYANVIATDLSGANMSGALLSGAELDFTTLRDAKGWTNEQLAQAESLVGATLPDGTVMTDQEAWEEFKRGYYQPQPPPPLLPPPVPSPGT